ncbi:hypothetical protein SAMN04487925_1011554 [Bradyrhizobium sp. cf659]|nr:hypothetical protein SAMN04487925_1011554 [Bradyrhizobium sp. cf659]
MATNLRPAQGSTHALRTNWNEKSRLEILRAIRSERMGSQACKREPAFT